MIAATISDAHLELDQDTLLDAFSLSLLFPGPPFNVVAYLGVKGLGTVWAAFVGWLAFVLPGPMLLLICLPSWSRLRTLAGAPAFMAGVGCGAMGIIMAFPRFFVVTKASDAVVCLATLIMVGYFNYRGVYGILLGGFVGGILSPVVLNIGQHPYGYAIHNK